MFGGQHGADFRLTMASPWCLKMNNEHKIKQSSLAVEVKAAVRLTATQEEVIRLKNKHAETKENLTRGEILIQGCLTLNLHLLLQYVTQLFSVDLSWKLLIHRSGFIQNHLNHTFSS